MANKLSDVMEKMYIGNKRSFTQACWMIWHKRRQFQNRSSFTAGETSIDIGPTEVVGWAPPVGGLIKGSVVLIRPAKGFLSFFAQEPPRIFVPVPPLCSGGTW